MAYLYDLGLGVPASPKLAAQLYEQAAELGELKAMLNLGILLMQGKPGVDKDYVEAYKWLDLARFYTQSSNDMNLKWRARGKLDELSALMTPAQIEKARSVLGVGSNPPLKINLVVRPNQTLHSDSFHASRSGNR